jgi:hypothetical protein
MPVRLSGAAEERPYPRVRILKCQMALKTGLPLGRSSTASVHEVTFSVIIYALWPAPLALRRCAWDNVPWAKDGLHPNP